MVADQVNGACSSQQIYSKAGGEEGCGKQQAHLHQRTDRAHGSERESRLHTFRRLQHAPQVAEQQPDDASHAQFWGDQAHQLQTTGRTA